MYEIGELVLYGIHGICTVTGIERMRFGKEKADYYVLEPKGQPESKFYVPVANEAAVAKLRSLLSREEPCTGTDSSSSPPDGNSISPTRIS